MTTTETVRYVNHSWHLCDNGDGNRQIKKRDSYVRKTGMDTDHN